MGLLDEAIREHLELKRRGGGDPTEIAHQEREALAPVFPEDGAQPAGVAGDETSPAGSEPAPAVPQAEPGLGDGYAEAGEPPAPADFSSVGQETAELDMQAVLEADGLHDDAAEPASPAPRSTDEDSFEWEAPRASAQPPQEPDPGQERLSFE
jgi:hypothetical protein